MVHDDERRATLVGNATSSEQVPSQDFSRIADNGLADFLNEAREQIEQFQATGQRIFDNDVKHIAFAGLRTRVPEEEMKDRKMRTRINEIYATFYWKDIINFQGRTYSEQRGKLLNDLDIMLVSMAVVYVGTTGSSNIHRKPQFAHTVHTALGNHAYSQMINVPFDTIVQAVAEPSGLLADQTSVVPIEKRAEPPARPTRKPVTQNETDIPIETPHEPITTEPTRVYVEKRQSLGIGRAFERQRRQDIFKYVDTLSPLERTNLRDRLQLRRTIEIMRDSGVEINGRVNMTLLHAIGVDTAVLLTITRYHEAFLGTELTNKSFALAIKDVSWLLAGKENKKKTLRDIARDVNGERKRQLAE